MHRTHMALTPRLFTTTFDHMGCGLNSVALAYQLRHALAWPMLLAFLIVGVYAPEVDPVQDFCKLWDHQVTIQNDVLWIVGGSMVLKINPNDPNTETYWGNNTKVIGVALDREWDAKAAGFASNALYQYNCLTAEPSVPSRQRAALFVGGNGDDNIYLVGGTTLTLNSTFDKPNPPNWETSTVFAFSTKGKYWEKYPIEKILSVPANLPNAASWASAPEANLGLLINGQIDRGTSQALSVLGSRTYLIDGLLVIDTATGTAKNWSTTALTGGQPTSRGAAAFLPGVGTYGAAVRFGGVYGALQYDQDDFTEQLVSLETIDVLDIASVLPNRTAPNGAAKWFRQATTGDNPEPRMSFCIVTVPSPDNSSYHIYLYGGRDRYTFYDDVYVLSIPSFHWTRVYRSKSGPRAHHACALAGESKMISIGGLATLDQYCEDRPLAISTFDLNSEDFGSSFDLTSAPYQVSQKVFMQIGGDGKGGATMIPRWSSPDLASLFARQNSSSPSPSVPATHQGLSQGAKIGLGAGIPFGVMFLASLYWFSHYKIKRRSERGSNAHTDKLFRMKQWLKGIRSSSAKTDIPLESRVPTHDGSSTTEGPM